MVKVSDLRKSFKTHFYSPRTEILKGISFQIERGSVTGFLGANGSGKTTTIKCILGLIFPDSGSVEIFGSQSPDRNLKRRIGFLPERPYFYEYLTGEEFLRFYCRLSDMKGDLGQEIDLALERVGLSHAKERKLRGYSKGMLQRIGIAQALIHRPDFVILDEPMTGLDPDGRAEVSRIIRETANGGTTLFFSSHLLHDVEVLCDQVVILKAGEVAYQGATKDLLSRVQGEFVIRFSDKSKKMDQFKCGNAEELQQEIDRLRGEGLSILEVRKEGSSLEDVFVKLAF